MLGITYCSGNPDDYIDIIKVYYNNGISRKDEIQRCCEQKDWKNYTILVHALKSTSLTIGAVRLSNMAKRLEAAGKEKQEKIILESNNEMLKEYERVLEAIKNSPSVFPKSETPASALSGENLRVLPDEAFIGCLDKLSECLETFEIKSVEKYLEIDAWSNSPAMSKDSYTRLLSVLKNAGTIESDIEFSKVVDNTIANTI